MNAPQKSLEVTAHCAALLAHCWPTLVRVSELCKPGNQRYWSTSQARLQRWASWMNYFEEAPRIQEDPQRKQSLYWTQLSGLMHEMFTAELLTRTWTAVATAIDRQNGERELEPYASSVFVGHLEARQRCLRLLLGNGELTSSQAVELNGIRSRAERWSDLLLSYLSEQINVERWACDVERVQDFSPSTTQLRDSQAAVPLITASMTSSLFGDVATPCLHPDLNQRIADSLMTAFGPDVFDAVDNFQCLWKKRLSDRSVEIGVMLRDLVD